MIDTEYLAASIDAAPREVDRTMARADFFDQGVENVVRLRVLGSDARLRAFHTDVTLVIARTGHGEHPAGAQLAEDVDVPLRLLLVIDDRCGESVYSSLCLMDDVLGAIQDSGGVGRLANLDGIDWVADSLRCSLAPGANPGESELAS